jgi:hypothetical protein
MTESLSANILLAQCAWRLFFPAASKIQVFLFSSSFIQNDHCFLISGGFLNIARENSCMRADRQQKVSKKRGVMMR